MKQTTMPGQRSRVAAVAATMDISGPYRLAVLLLALAFLACAMFTRAEALDSENIRVAKALSNAYAEVVDHVAPSVVGITTEKIVKSSGRSGIMDMEELFRNSPFFDMPPGFGPRRTPPGRRDSGEPQEERINTGIGSGVILDLEGHILTNNHVVADADKIKVELPDQKGRTFEAEIVGRDPNSDLAVIKLTELPDNLSLAKLGDSDALKPGNIVIAIGSPMGFKQSVTAGVVSAKGRNLNELAYERFIQTDASINPGNSGGPLVNLDGEVVGINTMISTARGGGGSIGIGFAIPVNQAKAIVSQLIEKGTVIRGWLGIVMNPDDPDISRMDGHDGSGVKITEVDPSGPAAKGGIRRGDLLISFDNFSINDNEHLRYLVAETVPDREVPVTVLRGGEKVDLTITIEAQPDDLYTNASRRRGHGGADLDTPDEVSSSLGMSVRNLSDSLREKYNIADSVTEGVVVTKVDAVGEAKNRGIVPGTVIIEMGELPVKDVAAFRKILKENVGKGTETISLYVRYGNVSKYVPMRLK